ncbi:MAG: TonB-dependent receptor [Gammaproteobacteria bacterium]|nr:TonB-dependent receptor [Gammaproteobacteria bacterium]MCF6364302.1 TonB-dependent receptor [Gammaproteobacteria bacterium]
MKKRNGLFRGIFAIAALGMAIPAGATDDDSGTNPDAKVLDKVMVIGNPANIDEMPGSAYSVTTEDIREQNYDDVNQVLRKVPGVYVRQEEGFGLFSSISLRGVDTTRSAKVTVMEDGVLTAPAPYSAPAAYYTPTMGRMSGLEILKGSSQVKYGPQTTGGVINYLSTPIPLQQTVYLKSSFGSFGDQRTHAYFGNTLTTGAGQVGFLLEGYFRKNDGYKTIDETADFRAGEDTGFSKSDPMIKLSWEPDTAMYQRLEFKYGTSELDANETYLGLSEADFAADPFQRYSASRFDNIKTQERRSYLRYALAPSDDLDIIATLYQNTFSRNWYKLKDLRDVNGIADNNYSLSSALAENGEGLDCLRGDVACTLRVRANNRDYETQGVDVVSYYRFGTGAVEHEIATGIRFNQDQIIRFQWDDRYSQLANGSIDGMTPGTPGRAGDRLQKTDALAVFLQDTIKVGAWGFTPGIRIEQLDQTYIENYAGVKAPSVTKTNTMNLWAASFGTTYKFNDSWIGFGSVNRGSSPPSPKSATGGINEETSLAYELGARYTNVRQALAVETVAFYTDFSDMIAIDNIGGTGTGETRNFGKVRSYGLEFSSQYDAGIANGWKIKNPWYLTVTYTNATQQNAAYSDDPESIFSYGKAGNQVPYIPEWVFSLGTGVDAARWGSHISGSYVSKTFTTANNVNGQVNGEGDLDARFGTTDAYFVADISAYYRIANGMKLFGGIQNVADARYNVSRQPEGPRPGMPLFAYAGLEMDL